MKNIKAVIALLAYLSISSVYAAQSSGVIMLVTIPKCGTHLLIKNVKLILGKMVYYLGDMKLPGYPQLSDASLKKIHQLGKTKCHGHVPSSPNNVDFIRLHKIKTLFIYRDPRDEAVSAKYHNQANAPKPGNRTRDLKEIIKTRKAFFDRFLGWRNHPCVYTTRFEDLVGPEGGGSRETQLREITSIARHIGVDLTPARAEQIAEEAFGGMWTFRKGQIGAWKKEFTPEQKELCKKHFGQLLIDLGYEKDFDW